MSDKWKRNVMAERRRMWDDSFDEPESSRLARLCNSRKFSAYVRKFPASNRADIRAKLRRQIEVAKVAEILARD